VYGSRIVTGLAIVLGAMAALFLILAVTASLVFVFVSAVFGASAYFVWYHASGRLARRVYRSVESRARPNAGGGTGAGPRDDWESPRDGQRARTRANAGGFGAGARRAAAGGGAGDRQRRARPPGAGTDGPTEAEAYDALDLEQGADESAVKSAYREKVKTVHPDRPDGDEEQFKEVKAAYERLTD
jgi:hypothetical protein